MIRHSNKAEQKSIKYYDHPTVISCISLFVSCYTLFL